MAVRKVDDLNEIAREAQVWKNQNVQKALQNGIKLCHIRLEFTVYEDCFANPEIIFHIDNPRGQSWKSVRLRRVFYETFYDELEKLFDDWDVYALTMD